MRRSVVLGVLIGVGALSMMVAAAQQPAAGGAQAPKVVDVQKIKDNLYMLVGGGGNTAVFVGSAGVTVIDTKNPGWGQPILEKIKSFTDKPVTLIINTHTHGDHVSGNVEFPATVDIVTQENTKTNMSKMLPNSAAPDQTVPKQTIFAANGGKGMPKRTFKDKMTIGKRAEEIDLIYFGRGHTNGDAFVLFPALRVVHAGDLFSGKNIPLLDSSNGGSAVAIADSLQKAYNAITNVDTIITGHSTLMTRADLNEYIAFNREFMNDVRAAKKAGKTIDEVVSTWKIPAKYAGYAAPIPERLKNNVALAYKEIDGNVTR